MTARAGRFGLGRRCLRVLDAHFLPCISGPGPRIGSAHRRIPFGHCAREFKKHHQGRSEMAACRPVVLEELVNVKSSWGWRKRSHPSELLRMGFCSSGTRHFPGVTSVEQLRFLLLQLAGEF
jgi:hypothetical protein